MSSAKFDKAPKPTNPIFHIQNMRLEVDYMETSFYVIRILNSKKEVLLHKNLDLGPINKRVSIDLLTLKLKDNYEGGEGYIVELETVSVEGEIYNSEPLQVPLTLTPEQAFQANTGRLEKKVDKLNGVVETMLNTIGLTPNLRKDIEALQSALEAQKNSVGVLDQKGRAFDSQSERCKTLCAELEAEKLKIDGLFLQTQTLVTQVIEHGKRCNTLLESAEGFNKEYAYLLAVLAEEIAAVKGFRERMAKNPPKPPKTVRVIKRRKISLGSLWTSLKNFSAKAGIATGLIIVIALVIVTVVFVTAKTWRFVATELASKPPVTLTTNAVATVVAETVTNPPIAMTPTPPPKIVQEIAQPDEIQKLTALKYARRDVDLTPTAEQNGSEPLTYFDEIHSREFVVYHQRSEKWITTPWFDKDRAEEHMVGLVPKKSAGDQQVKAEGILMVLSSPNDSPLPIRLIMKQTGKLAQN
jgi:hypothetical protein